MLGFELSLLAITGFLALIIVFVDRGSLGETFAWVRAQRGQPASVWLIGVIILAVLTAVTVIAVQPVRANAAVKACEANERTIESALTAYDSAVTAGYPTVAAIPVTVATTSGGTTTAGTFSDPSSASTDYLGQLPTDPADPSGSYLLTVTGTSYSIQCPGGHPLSALKGLSGGSTASKGEVVLSSQGGFSAQ